MYYGSLIFLEQAPKQTDASALLANMTVGAVNLFCTVAAMFLIDRAGRRPLLLWACGGMALSLTALVAGIQLHGPAALFLIFVLLYVACFAVGMGPGVWIVMSEVFPTRVRGRAMSVATVCLWAACLLVTSTFLSLVNALTISGAFLLYAGISAAAFIFIWRAVPETKGRTLEEIERWWSHGGGSSA
jgi:MFS family permease